MGNEKRPTRDGLWATCKSILRSADMWISTNIVVIMLTSHQQRGSCRLPNSVDEEKLILIQGLECLYNLQYDNYDDSLIKDNCWKQTAEEVHVKCNTQAAQNISSPYRSLLIS